MERKILIFTTDVDLAKQLVKNNTSNITDRNINVIITGSQSNRVILIGYDDEKKYVYEKQISDKIFDLIFEKIDDMPMRKYDKCIRNNTCQFGSNMELYTDNLPDNTITNLGYKNEDKAIYTIEKIKNRSILYQITTINALYHRAKYHPNKTLEMNK